MARRKTPSKLQQKRSANVSHSWYAAWKRREEWQRTTKQRIRIYKIIVPDDDAAVFAVAISRVEAAGNVALHFGMVSEPEEVADDVPSAERQIEELRRFIAERKSQQNHTE